MPHWMNIFGKHGERDVKTDTGNRITQSSPKSKHWQDDIRVSSACKKAIAEKLE